MKKKERKETFIKNKTLVNFRTFIEKEDVSADGL